MIHSGNLILVSITWIGIGKRLNICLVSDVLPKEFSTPMFWSLDDIKELEGTDIVGKSTTCVA